jgi:cytochrome b561
MIMGFLETSHLTNSLLAFSLLGLGIINTIFVLLLIGRTKPPTNTRFLRWAHRITGYIFFALYLFIGAIMINKFMGFTFLPPKATIHSYIGVSIFPLILIKICINRFFKKFYNSLPVYGVMVLMAIFFQTALFAPFHLHVHHHEPDEQTTQTETEENHLIKSLY